MFLHMKKVMQFFFERLPLRKPTTFSFYSNSFVDIVKINKLRDDLTESSLNSNKSYTS